MISKESETQTLPVFFFFFFFFFFTKCASVCSLCGLMAAHFGPFFMFCPLFIVLFLFCMDSVYCPFEPFLAWRFILNENILF